MKLGNFIFSCLFLLSNAQLLAAEHDRNTSARNRDVLLIKGLIRGLGIIERAQAVQFRYEFASHRQIMETRIQFEGLKKFAEHFYRTTVNIQDRKTRLALSEVEAHLNKTLERYNPYNEDWLASSENTLLISEAYRARLQDVKERIVVIFADRSRAGEQDKEIETKDQEENERADSGLNQQRRLLKKYAQLISRLEKEIEETKQDGEDKEGVALDLSYEAEVKEINCYQEALKKVLAKFFLNRFVGRFECPQFCGPLNGLLFGLYLDSERENTQFKDSGKQMIGNAGQHRLIFNYDSIAEKPTRWGNGKKIKAWVRITAEVSLPDGTIASDASMAVRLKFVNSGSGYEVEKNSPFVKMLQYYIAEVIPQIKRAANICEHAVPREKCIFCDFGHENPSAKEKTEIPAEIPLLAGNAP